MNLLLWQTTNNRYHILSYQVIICLLQMRGHGDPAMLRKISSSSTQTTGATGPGETITEVSRPIRGRHCVT